MRFRAAAGVAMSERHSSSRVLGQSLFGLAGILLQKLLNLALVLLLARGLSREEFGTYSYIGVLLMLVGFVADLGLERVLVRELARPEQRLPLLLANAILLRAALGLIAAAVGLCVAWGLGLSGPLLACFLLGLAVFPVSLDPIARAYFQFRLQIDRFYGLALLSSLTFLVLVAGCLWLHLPLLAIFAAGLLNAFLLSLVIFVLLNRQVGLQWTVRRELAGLLLGDALQLGSLGFLFLAAMRIDQVLLFRWRDAEELAFYAAGVRLAEAFALIPEAAMLSLLPAMAASYYSRPEYYRQLRRLAVRYLAVAAIAVVLVAVLAGEFLLRAAFGAPFAVASNVVALLGMNMFFAFVGAVFLNEFLIARWLRSMVVVSATTVAANLLLNTLWIPMYGATGAAAATLASSALGFGFWFALPHTRPTMFDCVRELARPVAAGAIALAAAYLVAAGNLRGAALALAVYPVLLVGLGAVDRTDLRRWHLALKGVRPSWVP